MLPIFYSDVIEILRARQRLAPTFCLFVIAVSNSSELRFLLMFRERTATLPYTYGSLLIEFAISGYIVGAFHNGGRNIIRLKRARHAVPLRPKNKFLVGV